MSKRFFPSRPVSNPTIYAYKILNAKANIEHRTLDFKMRPEQEHAVEKTMQYFNIFKSENSNKTPHFLWNAKMRYGKTFATYQLAKKMGWKKVLVLTFKSAVQNAWDEDFPKHKKKELTDEEKECKSMRKQIQDKLKKFATRVPVFMFLTDFRERSLEDVITQLEPGLFKKVTGLNVKDFDLLVSLGVFNRPLMYDAVFKFKRYEDASLTYSGINMHEGEDIGLFDTTISREELYVQS